MDQTTLKATMAGFFHDIGKFADNAALNVTPGYIHANSQYLQSRNGQLSHHHAVYTAAFIEQFKNDLPPELSNPNWGEGDIFLNLAAGHHNPETPMQQIITEADWLTAGIDRDTFGHEDPGVSPRQYKATRLLPLFEQLRQPPLATHDAFKWAYPLKALAPETIFPHLIKAQTDSDHRKAYLSLFDDFANELKLLQHRDGHIALWFEHFESLVMRYCSQIPAARAGKVVPDVSLYDHCRLTAAFAGALYRFHRDTDTMDVRRIQDRNQDKFLLLCGNFYGIQDFIFTSHGETQKYRSKILRGRSFYVSLLTDLAADMLCREIGLAYINVIINAAGRFTILAPHTPQVLDAMEKVGSQVNDWLLTIGFGEVAMGFTSLKATPNDFMPNRFIGLWEALGKRIDEKKFAKIDLSTHGGAISHYLDGFDNRLESPLCPLCGKRPADNATRKLLPASDSQPICPICRDQVYMGTRLVRAKAIIITDAAANLPEKMKPLSAPIFGRYQLCFKDEAVEEAGAERILKYWDISLPASSEAGCHVTRRFINGYVPRYTEQDLQNPLFMEVKVQDDEPPEVGMAKTFHHISASAKHWMTVDKLKGLDALGVLKADVDELGMLMSCGLEEKRFTLSRMATLSRQLNYFFSFYLPYFLGQDPRFENVYTVFAGGDDLFLIGPWHRMYELCLELKDVFKKYVCENENIHFSAGIALHKSHTPLGRLAEDAERALKMSKNLGRNRFTIFNETIPWEELHMLETIRLELEQYLENDWVTNGMLYRLNGFIELAAREKKVLESGSAFIDEMECLKWRALFYYSAERNIGHAVKDKGKRKEIIRNVSSQMVGWLDRFKGNLRIPLWHILYNRR
jgi:CRISPR-associated protein Csm1